MGWCTVFPHSRHAEPLMPGDHTCARGAYTFRIPSALAEQDNVVILMKVQDAASIRAALRSHGVPGVVERSSDRPCSP